LTESCLLLYTVRMSGKKDDAGKPQHSLLPFAALESITRVMEYGAGKYGANNWQGVAPGRYVDAALRHLFAHCWGEELDGESGLPHLAHAATSLLFVLAIKAGGKR
jgi:hypothetical protein